MSKIKLRKRLKVVDYLGELISARKDFNAFSTASLSFSSGMGGVTVNNVSFILCYFRCKATHLAIAHREELVDTANPFDVLDNIALILQVVTRYWGP